MGKKKNKTPKNGTQSQVQTLHDEIASVLLGQIREQRKEAEDSSSPDENLTVCVSDKTIDNAIKLLRLNKTTAREDEDDKTKGELSELKRIRTEQRGRILHSIMEG